MHTATREFCITHLEYPYLPILYDAIQACCNETISIDICRIIFDCIAWMSQSETLKIVYHKHKLRTEKYHNSAPTIRSDLFLYGFQMGDGNCFVYKKHEHLDLWIIGQLCESSNSKPNGSDLILTIPHSNKIGIILVNLTIVVGDTKVIIKNYFRHLKNNEGDLFNEKFNQAAGSRFEPLSNLWGHVIVVMRGPFNSKYKDLIDVEITGTIKYETEIQNADLPSNSVTYIIDCDNE